MSEPRPSLSNVLRGVISRDTTGDRLARHDERYSGGGEGFEGIAARRLDPDAIYRFD